MHRIFDAHLHIIVEQFLLIGNNGFVPHPFGVDEYRMRLSSFDVCGGAIVSGSFQGFDQEYLKFALAELGEKFVGVTQLPETATDEEILSLDALGVRAVRFNLKRGGSAPVSSLESFARRVHSLCSWHIELYVDSAELAPLADTLAQLPQVSVDHLGLSREGLGLVCELAHAGVGVKATGFGRLDFPAEEALEAIHLANDRSLMFGTDLPSTRAPRAFEESDAEVVVRTLGAVESLKVLETNARQFYRLG